MNGRKRKRMQSTQQLLGIRELRDFCVSTAAGELVFFIVQPSNLSVLPEAGIRAKIRNLTTVLSMADGVELLAINARESYAESRAFYLERMEREKNPAIRALLEQDRAFLDAIQLRMAPERQFALLIRLREEQDEASLLTLLHDLAARFRDNGFTTRRADREELKRILAVCFEQNVTNEQPDDYDGQRYGEG